MDLTLLAVPHCPNVEAFAERLARATHGEVTVTRREVADDQEAGRLGMCGSPTLLIDGTDPFAMPGATPSLSCRIYRDDDGAPARVPTAAAFQRALTGPARNDGPQPRRRQP